MIQSRYDKLSQNVVIGNWNIMSQKAFLIDIHMLKVILNVAACFSWVSLSWSKNTEVVTYEFVNPLSFSQKRAIMCQRRSMNRNCPHKLNYEKNLIKTYPRGFLTNLNWTFDFKVIAIVVKVILNLAAWTSCVECLVIFSSCENADALTSESVNLFGYSWKRATHCIPKPINTFVAASGIRLQYPIQFKTRQLSDN